MCDLNRYEYLQIKRANGTLNQYEKDELLALCSKMLHELMIQNIDVFKRLKDK